MKTAIPPSAYHLPEVLQLEERTLFRRVWLFAGLKRELSKHLDYITFKAGGAPIFVQNFHGELRAFVNVCSHRFSMLHDGATGNRPLQCLYHGWAYNSEGVPVGIPDRPRFENLTAERLCELSLTRWQVETVGDVIFVAAPECVVTLSDFLSPATAHVIEWIEAFGILAECVEFEFQANWKNVVENTLEGYHVPLVHPSSLNWLSKPPGQNQIEGRHSSFSQPTGDAANRDFSKLSRLFDQRPVKLPGYHHRLVFPNLTIATTWGASFSLQHFEPISAQSTRVRSLVFTTRVNSQSVPEEWLMNFGQSVAKLNRVVFEEDRIACERVQRGVTGAMSQGILSDEELRVAEFHRQYQCHMS